MIGRYCPGRYETGRSSAGSRWSVTVSGVSCFLLMMRQCRFCSIPVRLPLRPDFWAPPVWNNRRLSWQFLCCNLLSGCRFVPLGYGVGAETAPGMTTQDAAYGQVCPLENPPFFDGLNGVIRTGRLKSAFAATQQWRQGNLV